MRWERRRGRAAGCQDVWKHGRVPGGAGGVETHALAREVGQQRGQRRLPRRVQFPPLRLGRPPLGLPLLRLLRCGQGIT